MLNTQIDMEAIAEAKRSDEVDEISDFGSEDNDIKKNKNFETKVEGNVSTKKEAREHVQASIESSVIANLLKDHVGKIVRVHRFMLMLVLRRRFLRKIKAIAKIQGFLQICLAKKQMRKRKTEIKEKERRRRMEIFTRLHKD